MAFGRPLRWPTFFVGVVFSVQAMPDQTAVYTIGYGIPIAALTELWAGPAAPR